MSRIRNLMKRFHEDERGSNSLEQVVIFAFGAVILGGAFFMWQKMKIGGEEGGLLAKIGSVINNLFNINFSTNSGG